MVETRMVRVSDLGTIMESVSVPVAEMRSYVVALHRAGGRIMSDPRTVGGKVCFSVVYR